MKITDSVFFFEFVNFIEQKNQVTNIYIKLQSDNKTKKKERSLHNVHRERVLLTAGNYLEIYIHNQDIFQILFGLSTKYIKLG